MSESASKSFIVFFRLAMGWTFLYAASHQVFDPSWSAVGFLNKTKTFHDFYAQFAAPGVAPYTTFLVEWGHLLIGLSLLFGLMTRVSAAFGTFLMIVYYFAHMDFPYIDDNSNFIMEFHLVYAGVLLWLIAVKAGHVWGLDAWVERHNLLQRCPALRPLFQ
jgi:thiosulfate dehydrogenase [quinone] large subunit